jgi:hypothetical protein
MFFERGDSRGLGEDEVADGDEGLLGLVPEYPVTRLGEDLKPRSRNRRSHIILIGDWRDRIEF